MNDPPKDAHVFHKPQSDNDILSLARDIITTRFTRESEPLVTPTLAKEFLIHRISTKEQEVFLVIFLDNRHRVIAWEEMFYGTIDGASVHPREVVKRALQHNAAAVILSHNHPGGVAEPSRADEGITKRLQDALALVDVRVLDHIVVGGTNTASMAEQGLL